MAEELSSSAQKVQNALKSFGLSMQVVELPGSTRTSLDAAQAVGCRVEQIAKSLVFKGKQTGKAILVIASGANRVNEKKVAELVGEPVKMADPDFTRKKTGFAIGGIPPVGHLESLEIFVDQDLMQYSEIWAAAGTPHAVFRLTPEDLSKITGGRITPITS